jgi:hypothetical protein
MGRNITFLRKLFLILNRPPLWSSGKSFLATDPEVPGSIPGPTHIFREVKGLQWSCDYSDNWSVWFSDTVLKSVAKNRLVKTKDFYVRCDYSDNWSVCGSVGLL